MSVKVNYSVFSLLDEVEERTGVIRTTSSAVFACNSKACAPPPVGTGGSRSTGGSRGRTARREALRAKGGNKAVIQSLKSGGSGGKKDRLAVLFQKAKEARFRKKMGKGSPMESVKAGLARRKQARIEEARKKNEAKLKGVGPADIYAKSEKVQAKDAEQGKAALKDGKVAVFDDGKVVNTMVSDLNKEFKAAKAANQKLPDVNLCKVSVPGTNLFCGDSLDIPRAAMPQLSGMPRKGSKADSLPKTPQGEVDGAKAFREYLTGQGIKTSNQTVRAASLKASQAQLSGEKVAGMMENKDFDPAAEPIYVSRDGYVIDGHHRWAAQVGRDLGDGDVGDLPMNVIVVDMDIKDVLVEANTWADDFGILPKVVVSK